MASGRVDAWHQSSKPSQSPILGRACSPLTPPEGSSRLTGRRLGKTYRFNFCHTSLLIFNISHSGPSLKNMKMLIFCYTYKLKRLFSFFDNSYISKTTSKTCLNPKIKIIKKRQGFSSKLMVQSLKIHLPKSHFRHFFITRVRTL